MARRFAGVACGIAAGRDRKMPRGVAGRRDWATRRDGGCGERDRRNVEGQQGHDPGGTFDADDMRPPSKTTAVKAG